MQKNNPYWQATNVPEYEGPPPRCSKCKDYIPSGYCPVVKGKYSDSVRKVRDPRKRPDWCPKVEKDE